MSKDMESKYIGKQGACDIWFDILNGELLQVRIQNWDEGMEVVVPRHVCYSGPELIERITKGMHSSAGVEDYETAALLRDAIAVLK